MASASISAFTAPTQDKMFAMHLRFDKNKWLGITDLHTTESVQKNTILKEALGKTQHRVPTV